MVNIEEATVGSIIKLTHELQDIRHIVAKKKHLATTIENMSPAEKWLITFLCWHCLFNSKFKTLDLERLCLDSPSEINKVTFQTFIKFLRSHRNVKITTSREKPLLTFLRDCDFEHRSFYLSLMTKEWINCFPVMEVQTLLDLGSINSEEVYGEIEYLSTGLEDLEYPVCVRRISDKKLTPFILIKEPLSTMLWADKGENPNYKRITKPKKLDIDLALFTDPRFCVAGFYDTEKFYPTDFFSGSDDCTNYLNGEGYRYHLNYRAPALNEFIARNLLVNFDNEQVSVCQCYDVIIRVIRKLCGKGVTHLLITGEDTTRDRKPFKLTCVTSSGIIEEVSANSVTVWFNGSLLEVPYFFEGKEQAMLSKPELLKGKMFDFVYFKVGDYEYYVGKQVNFDLSKWRNKPSRETGAWIEKCALCGGTKSKHFNRGVCKSCERNLNYYFSEYGTVTWIEPSKQMRHKRFKSVWKCDLLNSVGYKYKGCILEGREDGTWRFKPEGTSSCGRSC